MAPRRLRLQSRWRGGWRRPCDGTRRSSGSGTSPSGGGRHAAGIGRAGHGRRVRPRRSIAGDRGGRRADGTADRDPLAHRLGPAGPDPRGRARPGRRPSPAAATAGGSRRAGEGRTARAGSPPGTPGPAPCWGRWNTSDWSSPWRSTRMGAGIAVADYGATKVHLWDLGRGHDDHPSGADGRQLRRIHAGREAAGRAGLRRPRPPGRRADRRRGAGAPQLRPARRRNGFTPRLAFSPDGSRIVANAPDAVLNVWDLGPTSGLATEPEAGDLAGWLRRSRALAERGDAAGRRGRLGAGPRHQGRRRVPLDRARRVALSPRRFVARRGTPWTGPWRPCPTTPGDGSTSAGCSARRLDAGVGDGAGEGPVPLRAAARPHPRRRGGRRGPGRAAPGCRRRDGLDRSSGPT